MKAHRLAAALVLGVAVIASAAEVSAQGRTATEWLLIQIHHANATEVRLGQMALDRSRSRLVRKFAREMIADHRRNDRELMALARRLRFDLRLPGSRADERSIQQHLQRQRDLEGLSGRAFELSYLHPYTGELRDIHSKVQEHEERVTDPGIRQYLIDTMDLFRKQQRLADETHRRIQR